MLKDEQKIYFQLVKYNKLETKSLYHYLKIFCANSVR